MRLTNVSDYASRMLMYTASAGGRLITIEEAPRAFNVSKTHLKEVANTLTRGGYRKAIRGRSGGLVLGRRPEMIRIGDVVPLTEPDFALVECFATGNQSVLTASCKLSRMFGDAIVSFQSTLTATRWPTSRRSPKISSAPPTPPPPIRAAGNAG